jgi:microcystin-dependent protein
MAIAIDGTGTVTGVNILQTAGVPAGAIMAFAMNSAPSGWLSADGSAVSRTTYATLFTAIGTTHGTGDGSTTFNVPDLQGIFVRASGSQTIGGITYNKTFATKEGDAFQGHVHSLLSGPSGGQHPVITQNGNNGPIYGPTGSPASDGTNGTPRTSTETRPANIALLHCIKT